MTMKFIRIIRLPVSAVYDNAQTISCNKGTVVDNAFQVGSVIKHTWQEDVTYEIRSTDYSTSSLNSKGGLDPNYPLAVIDDGLGKPLVISEGTGGDR